MNNTTTNNVTTMANIQTRISALTSDAVSITEQDLIEKMLNVRGGAHTFGDVIVASVPKMNKTDNPFYGRVTKLAEWGCGINTTWAKKLNNAFEKHELVAPQIDLRNSPYVHYTDKPTCPVLRLKRDMNAIYFAIFPNKQLKFVEYYIDNVLATELELEQLKVWLPKPSVDKRQIESGIAESEQVIMRTPSIKSVVAIKVDKGFYKIER